jgi:hypothetical protein
VFIEHLLAYHLQRTAEIAEQEAACNTIDPELISVLVAYKTDLRFNRQLRVQRDTAPFSTCFEASNKLFTKPFISLWQKELNLTQQPQIAEALFELALENFYLQITEATLNKAWLTAYFAKLKQLVHVLKSTPDLSKLYGSD